MDSKQRIQVMTLANSIIGVSILAMPFCFKQCGIILSIVLLLFSSILCRLACHFLLKSAIKARLRTFEFLAYHVFGSVGKLFVEIGMIGLLLGTCVAFFVVMGDLGPQIIAQMTETKSLVTLRTAILIILGLLCVLPLGLLRNVDSLSSVCVATIGFYGVLVIKIILESVPQLLASDWYNNVDWWKPSGILQCIPIFSMALFCQTQLFEIYQALPSASLDKMNDVVKMAVNICTTVYIFVGVFGYIAVSHKGNFSGNILMDFQPSVVTEAMKLGFVLSVAFSFPLVIFPCRASLYSLLYRPVYTGLHDASNLYIPEGKFRFLTFFIVIVSLIIGVLIPNIELVLGLIGSTIGIMICVIFPAMCFICLTDKNTNERILAQLILAIGIAVMVLGTYANLYAIDNIAETRVTNINKLSINDRTKINIDIKDNAVKPKIIEMSSKVLKDIPIIEELNMPAVKEVRHEPPQPEEPQELAVDKQNQLAHIKDVDNNANKPKDGDVNKNEALQPPKIEVPAVPDSNQQEKPKMEIKSAAIVEVDLEAIKKEDQELQKADLQAKASLVEHKKLVAEEHRLVEESKKILEEIKIRQKEVDAEKVLAVKNIRLAAKAIQSIVDENIKDSKLASQLGELVQDKIIPNITRTISDNRNLLNDEKYLNEKKMTDINKHVDQQITHSETTKQVSKVQMQNNEETKIEIDAKAAPAPLSYQLGLQNIQTNNSINPPLLKLESTANAIPNMSAKQQDSPKTSHAVKSEIIVRENIKNNTKNATNHSINGTQTKAKDKVDVGRDLLSI